MCDSHTYILIKHHLSGEKEVYPVSTKKRQAIIILESYKDDIWSSYIENWQQAQPFESNIPKPYKESVPAIQELEMLLNDIRNGVGLIESCVAKATALRTRFYLDTAKSLSVLYTCEYINCVEQEPYYFEIKLKI